MESLKKSFDKKGFALMASEAEKRFIEKGYVHNDITGWEKKEVLDMFSLSYSMRGVPYHKKDKVVVISQNWIDYLKYKENQKGISLAFSNNEPPIDDIAQHPEN